VPVPEVKMLCIFASLHLTESFSMIAPMDHNQLDKNLRRRGWYYDNGWSHDGAHWDCYVDDNYGSSPCFVILAKDGNARLLILGKEVSTKEEVWAGPISSENDIDNLMSFIAAARGES
jgi:hypothetical protein